MKAEAKFNDRREPTIIVIPETQEDIDVLMTMRGKQSREDGNHMLVMGLLTIEGAVDSATFTTNPIGHPTTIIPTL